MHDALIVRSWRLRQVTRSGDGLPLFVASESLRSLINVVDTTLRISATQFLEKFTRAAFVDLFRD